MVLYMEVVVYAPALALEVVTGTSKSYSILIMGVVCTFYSVIGKPLASFSRMSPKAVFYIILRWNAGSFSN